MDYTGRIYRPLGEARSLLLQVTVGCGHDPRDHRGGYRERGFTLKPWAQLERELGEAAKLGPTFTKAFLCDDDALVLSQSRLERILTAIRVRLPWITKVGMYGDAHSVGAKSVDELKRLHHLGLDIIYHGVETGDETTLRRANRPTTFSDCVTTADKLRDADIFHSVMVMLGIGGRERSAIHAHETARLLTEMDPPHLATLTTTIVPNTPLARAEAEGRFVMPGEFELLEELHTIIDESELSKCLFSAQHPSNHLPLEAQLPEDRAALLQILTDFIDLRDHSTLRPDWLRTPAVGSS